MSMWTHMSSSSCAQKCTCQAGAYFPCLSIYLCTMVFLKPGQITFRRFCDSLVIDLKPEESETSSPGLGRWLTLMSPWLSPISHSTQIWLNPKQGLWLKSWPVCVEEGVVCPCECALCSCIYMHLSVCMHRDINVCVHEPLCICICMHYVYVYIYCIYLNMCVCTYGVKMYICL